MIAAGEESLTTHARQTVAFQDAGRQTGPFWLKLGTGWRFVVTASIFSPAQMEIEKKAKGRE